MSLIKSFRPYRPDVNRVQQVAAVPYDVVNSSEARVLAEKNPWSFLHISRAEIDLPPNTPVYSDSVYEKASSNFKKWIEECPLIQDPSPCLYVYQLKMGKHTQTGVVGAFSLEEYEKGLIKKHERTRKDKEDDRTRHIQALSSQTGPVFLAYRQDFEIDQEVAKVTAAEPLYEFVAEDQVFHSVWKVSNSDVLQKLFAENVKALYIADGHHRAASASRVRTEVRKKNSNESGGHDFFLAVAFPHSQLQILPYHRVVKDLNGMTPESFLEKIKTEFFVSTGDGSIPDHMEFGMFLNDRWYRIKPRNESRQVLDVQLLEERVLTPLLGIGDLRTDQRIDFVGGIRGTIELEKRVKSGEAAVAFSLHPTQIEQLMETSDRDEIMPPKSTWFEPKLRDGIFCYSF